MTTAVYPKFCEKLLSWAMNANPPAGLSWKFIVVNNTYIYDATHTGVEAVSVGSIKYPETALTGVTITNGIVDANDLNLTGLTLGDVFDAIIVYLKDGDGNSYLAAYIDESTDGSIPQTIGATQGVLHWNDSGIFQI